jgi:hypothetical protein
LGRADTNSQTTSRACQRANSSASSGRIDSGASAGSVPQHGHVGDFDQIPIAADQRERTGNAGVNPDDVRLNASGGLTIFRAFTGQDERIRSPTAGGGPVLAVWAHSSCALPQEGIEGGGGNDPTRADFDCLELSAGD